MKSYCHTVCKDINIKVKMIKIMLKWRKESDTYLTADRRHRRSMQIAMKVEKVCSFQPALWPSLAEVFLLFNIIFITVYKEFHYCITHVSQQLFAGKLQDGQSAWCWASSAVSGTQCWFMEFKAHTLWTTHENSSPLLKTRHESSHFIWRGFVLR